MNGHRLKNPQPPKAVIFDIGRVIVRIAPDRAVELLAAGATRGRNAQQLWAAVQADPRWDDWQEGRMEPREWHRHLMRQLELSLGFDEFCAAWNRTLLPEPILSESLFVALAARCKLALLSNTDPLHTPVLEANYSFLRHFPARIYSWRVGASKPAAAIYEAALGALGVAAAEALFIDDAPEFAEGARQVGMDAIRFENPAQLLQVLARRGLPVGD